MLEITYKTRVVPRPPHPRSDALWRPRPVRRGGGVVEVDETFIGQHEGQPRRSARYPHKMKVLTLVDRDTGRAAYDGRRQRERRRRSCRSSARTSPREARVMTDEAAQLSQPSATSPATASRATAPASMSICGPHDPHEHGRGYFSIFKRGMKGVYQHCGEQHLHRYLAEFEFRYNNRDAHGFNDADRSEQPLCPGSSASG